MRRSTLLIAVGSTLPLIIMFLISFAIGDNYACWTEAFSVGLVWIPAILAARRIIDLPVLLMISIGLALSLHSLGLVTNWYSTTFWWDKITHLMSGLVVGWIVAITLLLSIRTDGSVTLPVKWLPFFVFISVVALEATWEIMEFSLDQTIGTQMQHGLLDTVNDIATDVVSGIIVGFAASFSLCKVSVAACVANLRADAIVSRMRSSNRRRT
jgi:hypothetical protein